MDNLFPFILAALALVGSPGPNTLSLAAVGSAFGKKRGMKYMLGLNVGMALVILITGTGISGLLLAIPFIAPAVIGLASIYFLYLAYKIATAPPLQNNARAGTEPKWTEGVVISLLNPKAYASMAAMFSGTVLLFIQPIIEGMFKATLLMLVIVFVNIIWLALGAALTPFFKDPISSRIINICFAILLLVSVASTFLL